MFHLQILDIVEFYICMFSEIQIISRQGNGTFLGHFGVPSLSARWPCRQCGGWGEGKRKRARNAGKGEERREATRFSLFPSSHAHLLFPLSTSPIP